MNEPSNHSPINRVLIALDALKENDNTLEFAVALAARNQTQLMMLFIEDLNLIHLASLPFASEIDRISILERKLDSLQMTRSFRTQTQRLEKLLEQKTRQKHVNYSLKVVRGHYLQEALSATDTMDVLFLSKTVGRYGKRTLKLTPLKKMTYSNNPSIKKAVWIIYQGTAASNHALLMARDLAASTNKELVILIRSTEEKARQHKQQAISLMASQPISTHYVIVPQETEDKELISLLKDKECGLLVLPNDEQPTINHQIFLDELEHPVMLVR